MNIRELRELSTIVCCLKVKANNRFEKILFEYLIDCLWDGDFHNLKEEEKTAMLHLKKRYKLDE